MTIRLGVVMDPIDSIHYHKDSTLAVLEEAQTRCWQLYYFEQQNLFLRDGVPYGDARELTVFKNPNAWFAFQATSCLPLAQLDVILMRKDPPVDQQYIYTTYLLEHAERLGVLVVNKPRSLRDANEKLFATNFPAYSPPTLVTSSLEKLTAFWQEHGEIVCKPLNSMGGTAVFRINNHEANANVIFTLLTHAGTQTIMAQRFIPEIKAGDKRILLIDGNPIPYALARVPQDNDWRGNLVVGAKGIVQPLTARDRVICQQVGPLLQQYDLYFVGIDVIGDYLTEINVTSPTCIREIDSGAGLNISAALLDAIEQRLMRTG